MRDEERQYDSRFYPHDSMLVERLEKAAEREFGAERDALLESIRKEHNLILSTVCARRCQDDKPRQGGCKKCDIAVILTWFEEILDAKKEAEAHAHD